MSKAVNFMEIEYDLREMLNNSGEISFIWDLSDMMPLIRASKDVVTLSSIDGCLNRNDVVLFQREDGKYALSRIMFVNDDTFVLCCDSKIKNEYKIKREQIIGRLLSFDRNSKTHKMTDGAYKTYVAFLPIIKIIRRYTFGLLERAKDFIKYLRKR